MVIVEPQPPTGAHTAVYSVVDGLNIELDFWVPPEAHGETPVFVFFHGGGVVAGSRKHERTIWVPLHKRAMKEGFIFVSADYRLLVPSTGLDIIQDIKQLFVFLTSPEGLVKLLPAGMSVDAGRIAVCGDSGGGYVARIAAVHAVPRPAAHLNIFGMGADCLNDRLLGPSSDRPAWDVADAREYLSKGPPAISEDKDAPFSIRMRLMTVLMQKGIYLDYLLAKPGISDALRKKPYAERRESLPDEVRPTLPELHIDGSLPPTVLIHGNADTLVHLADTEKDYQALKQAGVKTELIVVDKAHHMFFNEWPPSASTHIVPSSVADVERAMDFVVEAVRTAK